VFGAWAGAVGVGCCALLRNGLQRPSWRPTAAFTCPRGLSGSLTVVSEPTQPRRGTPTITTSDDLATLDRRDARGQKGAPDSRRTRPPARRARASSPETRGDLGHAGRERRRPPSIGSSSSRGCLRAEERPTERDQLIWPPLSVDASRRARGAELGQEPGGRVQRASASWRPWPQAGTRRLSSPSCAPMRRRLRACSDAEPSALERRGADDVPVVETTWPDSTGTSPMMTGASWSCPRRSDPRDRGWSRRI